MKILKSFDTKLDVDELNAACEKYGEGNVILVKRHWVKLLTPLFLVVLSIFLLMLMLYSIYLHTFDEHKTIFWILAIFYAYTSVSWCLFVIIAIVVRIYYWAKQDKQYIDHTYNGELKKKGFDKFIKRTILTFIVHTIVLIFNATFPFIFINETGLGSMAAAIGILVIDLIFLFLLNRVLYMLIEYEMTFNLCTKDGFTTFNQKGFFRADSMKIASSAIKVIKSTKEGLSGALFQYGNLYIYTDGDLNDTGGKNLQLTYVPDPSVLAKKLNAMIDVNKTEGNEAIA